MSTTEPVNQSAMPQGGINVYIRDSIASTRYKVGVIDDPAFELWWEVVDVDYHNWTTKKVKNWDKESFTFKMYELRPELIEIINKWLSAMATYNWLTTVAAYPQTIKAWEWWYADDWSVILKYPNTSWVIAPTSVVWSVDWALVVTTDYTTWSFGNDYSYIRFVDSLTITTLAQDIVVTYDAIPTKWFYEKPNSSWMPTWFICETEWNWVDSIWGDMQILKIFENCQPDKPVVTFQGDKDDKWAYIEVVLKWTVKDIRFVWFETA